MKAKTNQYRFSGTIINYNKVTSDLLDLVEQSIEDMPYLGDGIDIYEHGSSVEYDAIINCTREELSKYEHYFYSTLSFFDIISTLDEVELVAGLQVIK